MLHVICKKGGEGIPHPRRGFHAPQVMLSVARRVGNGFHTHVRRISRPQVMLSVARRVGNGFPNHDGDFSFTGDFLFTGVCQEGWERDFPPTGDFSRLQVMVSVARRVGNGFPTHGGDFTPTGDVKCCKKGGEGIPHPRGGFLTHGQVC